MKIKIPEYIKKALYYSLGYIIFCEFYIWFSGEIASHITTNVENLARIELIKGILFVLITGFLLFLYLIYIIKTVYNQNSTIKIQNETLGEKDVVIMKQSVAISDQRKIVSDYERQALAGIYAASIGHDINNYLTICLFIVNKLMTQQESCEDNEKLLTKLDDALNKIEGASQTLKVIGKKQISFEISKFDIGQLLDDTIELAKKHNRINRCMIKYDRPEPVIIESNAGVIDQCIINLLLNAADAVNQNGLIEIKLINESDIVRIEVHDNGKGVPEEKRKSIFDAYVTDKKIGTGLGLTGIKMSMELLKGDITVGTSGLGGAVFTLTLPKSVI